MPRPSCFTRAALTAAAAVLTLFPAARADEFRFVHENVLGTTLELRVAADGPEAAGRAEAAVLREIDRLNQVFSRYDAASEFLRWRQAVGRAVAVSADLYHVLEAADRWHAASGGAFEPRVQAVAEVWKEAAKAGRTPSTAELAPVLAHLNEPAWRLDPAGRTAECRTELPLSLDAIAKGFIVDCACEAGLTAGPGVSGLMVAVGGDMRVRGNLSPRIGIADPRRDSETTEPLSHLVLRQGALASSGGYQRGLDIAGQHYSHIFDTTTGRPTGPQRAATVVAGQAVEADALATILCVLPVEKGLALVESTPGAACLLVDDAGQVHRSKGWTTYETARPRLVSYTRPATAPPQNAGTWNPAYELLVQFEIQAPAGAGFGYRRPYVAVWVEDKDGVPVRTLVLWVMKNGPGPRWIPDLRRWYRADQVRKLVEDADLVETIARATRPAGKYQVIWDGKDDQGRLLDAGTYTLSIEAAREHGTYQIIRKPITLGDKPFREDLPGNVEIKSASAEYRRRATTR